MFLARFFLFANGDRGCGFCYRAAALFNAGISLVEKLIVALVADYHELFVDEMASVAVEATCIPSPRSTSTRRRATA